MLFPFIIIPIMLMLALLAGVFWLAMMIDCLKYQEDTDKLTWALVIIFLNLLGAILYYLIAKKK